MVGWQFVGRAPQDFPGFGAPNSLGQAALTLEGALRILALRLELRAAEREPRVEGRAFPAWHPSVSKANRRVAFNPYTVLLGYGFIQDSVVLGPAREFPVILEPFMVLSPAHASTFCTIPQGSAFPPDLDHGQTSWRGGPWGEPAVLVTAGTGLRRKVS